MEDRRPVFPRLEVTARDLKIARRRPAPRLLAALVLLAGLAAAPVRALGPTDGFPPSVFAGPDAIGVVVVEAVDVGDVAVRGLRAAAQPPLPGHVTLVVRVTGAVKAMEENGRLRVVAPTDRIWVEGDAWILRTRTFRFGRAYLLEAVDPSGLRSSLAERPLDLEDGRVWARRPWSETALALAGASPERQAAFLDAVRASIEERGR
jgi:hypothetical protein